MKVLKVVLSVLLSTLLFSQTVFAYNPKTDRQYLDYSPLYLESTIDNIDSTADAMIDYVLFNTPDDIWNLFTQEGVNIYITQSVPKGERGTFDGVTYPAKIRYNGAKQITSVTSPVSIYIYHDVTRADTYLHECGHALDDIAVYITGTYAGDHPISNSPEWQALYAANAPIMATFDSGAAQNMYSASEGFAEAYRLYFSYPGQLQSQCPGVYSFVANQIAKYTSYVPPLTYDNFNYVAYALCYDDVYQAYGLDKKALWDHYINFGKAEGREAFRVLKEKR